MAMEIKCPKCKAKFELTDSLAAPLLEKAAEDSAKAVAAAREEATIEARRRAELDAAAKAQGAIKAAQTAAEEADRRRVEAEGSANAYAIKLRAAQDKEAQAIARERALEDRERELNLEIQRQVSAGAAQVREEARRLAEESIGLQVREREETIAALKRSLEDMQRKADQGSQQSQGEAQELALEEALANAFPSDNFIPVAKGVKGADCIHEVSTRGGESVGRIVYESKRTKAWSESWVQKLKDDARACNADIMVIVTTALPPGMKTFGMYEGIHVTPFSHAIAIAAMLRIVLLEVYLAKSTASGMETKAELVYKYLTGPQFKGRVSGIAEAFNSLREDLEAEKKAITRGWAKREAQIERALTSTMGMYGDVQAIAGSKLKELEGASFASLGKA